MIVDCLSDLHGHYPHLEGGDLLIIAGDCTRSDTLIEWAKFFDWLKKQNYRKKILVGGNHDNFLQSAYPTDPIQRQDIEDIKSLLTDEEIEEMQDLEYLCDSGTEITYYPYLDPPNPDNMGVAYKRKTFKIWGSPWTKTFQGMNPNCKAFAVDTEEELAGKWALIPDDVDILITHSPPFTILDRTSRGRQVGSTSLMAEHIQRLRPRLWVVGHIHEGYGQEGPYTWNNTKYVNASIMNESYDPVNKPVRIELC
jgi:Icc-related predicted phosphoesterase